MKFQHQTVKHLFNLALRQSVMSQRQCLLSSKQKMCMSHSLVCSLQSPISEMTNCAQVCYLHARWRTQLTPFIINTVGTLS